MIAYLEGTVAFVQQDSLVVQVGGVGYAVTVSSSVIEQAHIGGHITVYTHHHIREDAMDLYGFLTREEVGLFQQLIQVNGVGPKLAMAIMSTLDANTIEQAIVQQNVDVLKSVSGVGKRTAERIILDLKDSIAALPGETLVMADNQAMQALQALGFSQVEAQSALAGIDTTLSIEEQIREALKQSR